MNIYIYITIYNYIPGSSKKTSTWNHIGTHRYLTYPRNPQLQCCDRKCRASSTEIVVFWMLPNTKCRQQHWSGERRGPHVCGVVLHGMAVFFEKPGIPIWKRLEFPRNATQGHCWQFWKMSFFTVFYGVLCSFQTLITHGISSTCGQHTWDMLSSVCRLKVFNVFQVLPFTSSSLSPIICIYIYIQTTT
jgi:hypothetical protein